MTLSSVIKKFLVMTDMSEKEANKWRFLCEGAISYINSRLRKKRHTEEEADRLSTAAAVFAKLNYAQYTTETGNLKRFSAGDLTVEQNTLNVADERVQWQRTEKLISDLLRPDKNDVVFMSF